MSARKSVLLSWLYASVVAVVAVAIITQAGLASGADTTTATGQPLTALTPQAYIPVIVLVMGVGALGWLLIVRRVPRARLVLGILIGLVFVLSQVPVFTFGLTVTTAVTLFLVHAVTLLIGVLVFSRLIK